MITDLTISRYDENNHIIFCKIFDEKTFREYLEVSYTKNGKCLDPIYFKWKNIPKNIYILYRQSRKKSKILYNKNTDEYELYGSHFTKKNSYFLKIQNRRISSI